MPLLLVFQRVGVLQVAADVLFQVVDPAVVVAMDAALSALLAIVQVGAAQVGEVHRRGVVGDADGGGMFANVQRRSEERRVGKECRSGGGRDRLNRRRGAA